MRKLGRQSSFSINNTEYRQFSCILRIFCTGRICFGSTKFILISYIGNWNWSQSWTRIVYLRNTMIATVREITTSYYYFIQGECATVKFSHRIFHNSLAAKKMWNILIGEYQDSNSLQKEYLLEEESQFTRWMIRLLRVRTLWLIVSTTDNFFIQILFGNCTFSTSFIFELEKHFLLP